MSLQFGLAQFAAASMGMQTIVVCPNTDIKPETAEMKSKHVANALRPAGPIFVIKRQQNTNVETVWGVFKPGVAYAASKRCGRTAKVRQIRPS